MSDLQRSRWATDMYHLGSLLLFFYTRVGTTAALAARLDSRIWYREWQGTYVDALPFVRSAFDDVSQSLIPVVPPTYRDQLVEMFRQLCDPDPVLRGTPKVAPGTNARYALDRYVTTLDLLARKAEMRLQRQGHEQ